jgi:cyclopropane-fatty-acyl-phospholipid synthase
MDAEMILLNRAMKQFIRCGSLRIIDADGNSHRYAGAAGPNVAIRLSDKRLYKALVFRPELATGEAYVDGTLVLEEGSLRDLLALYQANRGNFPKPPLQNSLKPFVKKLRRMFKVNTPDRSRRNVAHHYDISNELYSLFLDEGLNYSCAYFRAPEDTLETAQKNKLRHIAAKLDLKPGQRVLDIGCGWGSMAIYLAEASGVEVTGITLSVEQLELARKRAAERGLEGRVKFELMDYRSMTGQFDRIVSVGMFEHVGVRHYEEYFAKIAELLTPDGVALVHSIGRRGGPSSTGPWIEKYIFPGGYSPALSEMTAAVEASKLWVTDIETWRLHYAETLKEWERRFQTNRARVAALLDERFCRMWEFYLVTSEYSFRHLKHVVFQVQVSKALDTLPLTRDYIGDAERSLPLDAGGKLRESR